jgi:hypothetical protein
VLLTLLAVMAQSGGDEPFDLTEYLTDFGRFSPVIVAGAWFMVRLQRQVDAANARADKAEARNEQLVNKIIDLQGQQTPVLAAAAAALAEQREEARRKRDYYDRPPG